MAASFDLRYAAVGAALAVAWCYQRARKSTSDRSAEPIPSFRRLEIDEAREKLPEPEPTEDFAVCRVLVLGSGAAGGSPKLPCLLRADRRCKVCADAEKFGAASRNTRMPPSLMVEIRESEKRAPFVLLVDCGQAMKRQMLIAHQRLGTKHIDGVLLTQGIDHKYVGFNDLREVQHANGNDSRNGDGRSILICASAPTLKVVEGAFPFLFQQKEPGKTKTLVAGLTAWPVPESGGYLDFQCSVPVRGLAAGGQTGYVLGSDEGCVAVLPNTRPESAALGCLRDWRVELVVIGDVAGEAELSAALDLVRTIEPARALLTGLGCGMLYSDAVARVEAEDGLPLVEIAYDEMCAVASVGLRNSTCGRSTSSASTTPGFGSSDSYSCGPDLPGVEQSRFEFEGAPTLEAVESFGSSGAQ